MPSTITAGGTAFGSWAAWSSVQHGTGSDKGYNATPPGIWITPQRAIMKAGDLIGVRAACPIVCGTLSVTFSLDNGPDLVVTAPTVATDEWGKTAAYWFVLPSGLSQGRHEIRARLTPSIAGNDRILQGNIGNQQEWTTPIGAQTSSLVIAIDPEEFYVVVESGGAGTYGDFGRVSINGALGTYNPTPVDNINAASDILRAAMEATLGTNAAQGGVIYVKAGNYNANVTYIPNSLWWLTIKKHPSVAIGDVVINSGNTGSSPTQASWIKYQSIDFDGANGGSKLYCASGSNTFWFDSCRFIGNHQTLDSYGVLTNNTNKRSFLTNHYIEHVNAQGVGVSNVAFVRNLEMDSCTSDIFTSCDAVVGFEITNHRSLNNGTDINGTPYTGRDQHGDLKQQVTDNISGAVLCDGRLTCVTVAGDNPVALFQGDSVVSQNIYFENLHGEGLGSGGADFNFFGNTPLGQMLRHCSFNKPLAIVGTTWNACEIVNCVFGGLYADGTSFYATLKTNGTYQGNHNIGSVGEDTTDTTGSPQYVSGITPLTGGNLTGRTRVTLFDADNRLRTATTAAGSLSAPDEYVADPVFSIPTGKVLEPSTSLTLTSSVGASIYYTTNGSTPTAASTLYAGPFVIAATSSIKAIAIAGADSSDVITSSYTVITNGTPAPPTNVRFTP